MRCFKFCGIKLVIQNTGIEKLTKYRKRLFLEQTKKEGTLKLGQKE